MIISRTPLRISLGGGGTDLPAYYRAAGHGFLIAAAINKYVYIAAHRNFEDDVLLKYSSVERVARADEAKHPLLRSCLLATGVGSAIEITSMADIPAGTGLGSSGSFTVGVPVWTPKASLETLELAPSSILFTRSSSTGGLPGQTGMSGEMPTVMS